MRKNLLREEEHVAEQERHDDWARETSEKKQRMIEREKDKEREKERTKGFDYC